MLRDDFSDTWAPHAILFSVDCFGTKITIEVYQSNYTGEITWGYIGAKAIRKFIYLKASYMKEDIRRALAGSSIFGLKEAMTSRIYLAEEDVGLLRWDLYDPHLCYNLLLQGPVLNYSDDEIRLFFIEFIDHPAELIELILVSRRFKRIFSDDASWDKINMDKILPWSGIGHHLTEERLLWQRLAFDNEIPKCIEYRLRWTAHNSSRMKFFYGTLAPSSPSFSQWLSSIWSRIDVSWRSFNGHNEAQPFTRSVVRTDIEAIIPIISCCNDQLSKRLMRQLHFMIPASATRFHLPHYNCATLVKSATLIDVEESPKESRTRRAQHLFEEDAGTRVELSRLSQQYRRIGDNRLTFVQIQETLTTDKSRWPGCDLRCLLEDRAIGMVAYFHWSSAEYIPAKIKQLLKSQIHLSISCPMLILIAIDGPMSPKHRDSLWKIAREIDADAIVGIGEWYLQPFDATVHESNLKCGIYCGWNWLLRTLSRNKERLIR